MKIARGLVEIYYRQTRDSVQGNKNWETCYIFQTANKCQYEYHDYRCQCGYRFPRVIGDTCHVYRCVFTVTCRKVYMYSVLALNIHELFLDSVHYEVIN